MGSTIFVSANAAREEGAGTTVCSETVETVNPVVSVDTSAVTLVVPATVPVSTLTIETSMFSPACGMTGVVCGAAGSGKADNSSSRQLVERIGGSFRATGASDSTMHRCA